MAKLHLIISEFIRRPDLALPIDVADRILLYHIWPMNPIRIKLDTALIVSDKSGYRPQQHELERGRSGTGEHSYPTGSKGATDWTTTKAKLPALGELMDSDSLYTRLCWYPDHGFYHGDYKHSGSGKQYFIQRRADTAWVNVTRTKWLEEVRRGKLG